MRQLDHISLDILSSREKQCAYFLLNGMTAKEIGHQLGLSNRTIETYIEHIKIKLQCRNKTQLIIALTKISL